MSTPQNKTVSLTEALDAEWPVLDQDSSLTSSSGNNYLNSPKLLGMLLQDGFSNQRLDPQQPIIPQLAELDRDLGLSHTLLNRLYLADLYFLQVARHSNLDPEVLGLFNRLRPAVVKSMTHSDNFLTNPRHLLRTTMEDLCKHGIGWEKSLGKPGDLYLSLLNNIVTIAVDTPDEKLPLRDAYSTTLHTLEDLAQRYLQLETRLCEAEQANLQNEKIRCLVENTLNRQIKSHKLPNGAVPFLQEIWRDYLHRILIVHHENSVEWQTALQTSNELIFCLIPSNTDAERQQKQQIIPILLKTLRQELVKAGYVAGKLWSYDELVAIFKRILLGETIPVETVQLFTDLDLDSVATIASSSIAENTSHLVKGQWLLYKNEKGESTRGRIALVTPDTEMVLLVNLLGGRPHRENIKKMGLDLSTKRARILIPKTLPSILLDLTINLFLKRYQDRRSGESVDQAAEQKRKSAEKALAEAQKLRDSALTQTRTASLADTESSQISAMVHELKIGSWLSMKNRLGEQMPCKIAVIYASSGKMVIVDKAGLRVGEFLRPELTQLILNGEAAILEMADSFENSLSRVIQTLRKNP